MVMCTQANTSAYTNTDTPPICFLNIYIYILVFDTQMLRLELEQGQKQLERKKLLNDKEAGVGKLE